MASPEELKAAAEAAGKRLDRADEMKALAAQPPRFSEMPLGRRALSRLSGGGREDPLGLERAANIAGMSMMGASAGARTPVAPGPAGIFVNPVTGALAGGAAGAALGTFAPETALEVLEFLGALPEGTRKREGLSNEELRAIAEAEALIDIAMGGTLQSMAQLARGGVRALTGVGGDVADRVALGPVGERQATAAKRQGIDLPAFMAGAGKIGKGFVNIFGRFPLVGGPFKQTAQKAATQTDAAIRGVPARIGPLISETDLGRQIYKNARTMVKLVGRRFNQRYENLFREADEAGVVVAPRNTLAKADELLERIENRTVQLAEGEGSPGPVLEKVRDFLRTNVLPIRATTDAGVVTQKQTLEQMDGLLENIDQEIASLAPKQRRFATALLVQLKTAIQADVLTNISGERAQEIGRALRALDTEFSRTMQQLFETATAQRFLRVRRTGLRGTTAVEATQTPVDQLAKTVVNLDSPQAIEELSRIVSADTMKKIAARSIKTVVDDSFSVVGNQLAFRPTVAARKLGFGMENIEGGGIRFVVEDKGRVEAVAKLLKKAGAGLGVKDVRDILNVAEIVARANVPDINTFIARSVALRVGAAGQSAIDSLVRNAAGALMFLFGGRGIARLLSDPLAARPFKEVLKDTTKRANRKVNFLRSVKAIAQGMQAETDATPADVIGKIKQARDMLPAIFGED